MLRKSPFARRHVLSRRKMGSSASNAQAPSVRSEPRMRRPTSKLSSTTIRRKRLGLSRNLWRATNFCNLRLGLSAIRVMGDLASNGQNKWEGREMMGARKRLGVLSRTDVGDFPKNARRAPRPRGRARRLNQNPEEHRPELGALPIERASLHYATCGVSQKDDATLRRSWRMPLAPALAHRRLRRRRPEDSCAENFAGGKWVMLFAAERTRGT